MRITTLRCITLLCLLCGSLAAAAQTPKADSLSQLLKTAAQDTNRVNILNALCWEQRAVMPDRALLNGEASAVLAHKLDFAAGEAKARNNLGVVYHLQGKYEQALFNYERAMHLYKQIENDKALAAVLGNVASVFQAKGESAKALDYYSQSISYAIRADDRQRIAIALGSIGIIYYDRGYYAKSLGYYLQSLSIREELGDKQGMAYALGNIGLIYDAQRNYPKALRYYYKSLSIRRELNDKQGMASSLINIGMVHFVQKEFDKAKECFVQSLQMSEDCGYNKGIAASLQNLGDVYREKGEYSKAIEFFERAIQINLETEDLQGMANALHSMGIVNRDQGNFLSALGYFRKSEEIARRIDNKEIVCNNLFEIAHACAKTGNFREAYASLGDYTQMKDSLYSEESMIKLADMEVKYESDKKEQEILELSKERELQKVKIERNSILFFMSGAVFLLLLGFAGALFYSYRHRQKLRRLTLMRESEVAIRNRVVETEERERKRFAKDLHDGLGPLLSAVKIYVNELQDEESTAAEKKDILKYVNDLIDEAVRDTRTIANNLMPAMIAEYGLVRALQSFIEKIRQSKVVNITFHADVLPQRMDATLEITLYRVVLELINNTVKHAAAKNIEIHLLETTSEIEISYKDDGKGFNVEEMLGNPNTGLGLRNISNRISTLEGTCEFRSNPGQGLMVRIEIKKEKYNSGIKPAENGRKN
jgi:signal transduction histidine kinase